VRNVQELYYQVTCVYKTSARNYANIKTPLIKRFLNDLSYLNICVNYVHSFLVQQGLVLDPSCVREKSGHV
jgi:hypothetical protein